jgi:glucokinase
MFLGIEIGGTKLQVGVGAGDGVLSGLWRGTVDVAAGPDGIRRRIAAAVPELLATSGIDRSTLRGVGIGFGGPVDDSNQTIIKSHQIDGWDGFPLADWISDLVGLPAALGNDADVAGLAEALHGAGKGMSPIFYITVGSGIGGGFIIDGQIYRGCGRGAAEIGHLRVPFMGSMWPLESLASGWGMTKQVDFRLRYPHQFGLDCEASANLSQRFFQFTNQRPITAQLIAEAAGAGDLFASGILVDALQSLAEGIGHVLTLLCPKRIVIGGGVSLIGEELFFQPLRRFVIERTFKPFEGLTDIVPASLGEAVVVHGALALARQRLK